MCVSGAQKGLVVVVAKVTFLTRVVKRNKRIETKRREARIEH